MLNNHFDPKEYVTKLVEDYDTLRRYADFLKACGKKLVVTIGSWDMLHIGHLRYLIKARAQGMSLIVGVDTDRAIKLYKGDDRPIIPQAERAEMLTFQHCVDFVTYVDDVDESGAWQYGLLDKVEPDVFVAVEDSYPDEQRREIEKRVGQLVVLGRQAEETSSTDVIQTVLKGHLLRQLHKLEGGN